jgi:hypothetical protein
MILARKKSSDKGKAIPQDWSESLARLLNETYQDQCKKQKHYFDVFGQIFSEELLVIISYLAEQDESLTPRTLFLSCEPEQMSSEQKVKATLEHFIELTGLFFDEIFSREDWDEFEPNWQEVTHKHQNYFYKITRENINLTIEADRLLGDDFEEI